MATASDFPKNTVNVPTSEYFSGILKRMPLSFIYTLVLFLASRLMLTIVGVISENVIGHLNITEFWDYFSIWDVWDSQQYINIARDWYPHVAGFTYAYFPLYPLLMKLLTLAINNYYFSGLVISNVCLFIACFYIYRLVRLESDEHTARRAIKYLILFPTAFILSAVMTESLFLALTIACFYYARKHAWLASGILGMLAALTRPYGVVIFIPMAYEYLSSANFNMKNIRADVMALLLIPLGVCLNMAHDLYLTGDPFAFVHAQSSWGALSPVNPIRELLTRLTYSGMDIRFNALMALAAILLLTVFYKQIGFSQLVYGLLLILIPLSSPASAWSMSRYILAVFPLFIIGAKMTKNPHIDEALTICLAMFQGLLMVTWVTWGFYVI